MGTILPESQVQMDPDWTGSRFVIWSMPLAA